MCLRRLHSTELRISSCEVVQISSLLLLMLYSLLHYAKKKRGSGEKADEEKKSSLIWNVSETRPDYSQCLIHTSAHGLEFLQIKGKLTGKTITTAIHHQFNL